MERAEYTKKLEEFFKWACWTEGDWCGNIDGDEIQDKAEALGLIELTEVKEPCCDGCACAEVYSADEFPVQCYRYVEPTDET